MKTITWNERLIGSQAEIIEWQKLFIGFVAVVILSSCQAGFEAETEPFTEMDFSADSYDTFDVVGKPVATIVDNHYPASRELLKTRTVGAATHETDTCSAELNGRNTFGDRIAWAINKRMRPIKPRLGYVSSYFGLSSSESSYLPNGLLSHPLCKTTKSTFNTVYEGKNVPSQTVIDQVNKFVDTMNKYRSAAIQGDGNATIKAQKLWTKLYMCLSYAESLTTADSTAQDNIAKKYLPAGMRRPAGVSFYEAELLNVGLYQFDPNSGGNVQGCIREWNDMVPSCPVSKTASDSEMVQMLAGSHQTFNAFCGVSKVTAMMGVQVNSTNAKNTYPTNVKANGDLLDPEDRCVSFTMNVNTSYNHFAPFQNGYGNTLGNIMTCTLKGEY